MNRPWASTKKEKMKHENRDEKQPRHNLIGPHVQDAYVGSNEAPSHRCRSTTIAQQPPAPVDCLERVLKVPRTHLTL